METKPLPDTSFFVMPTKKPASERTLIEKGISLLNLYPKKDNIRFIDKMFLVRHGLSITVLITECKVGITNLKAAGILSTYQDLCDLGFSLKDLVIDRELFGVNHIVQLYDMDATSLGIHVHNLIECRFSPAELMTLGLSIPDMIEEKGITARHIHLIGYSLANLRQLGVTKEHMRQLGITYPMAVNVFKWDHREWNMM